ncbi:unnamed protein product [Meganyctiphanes norvegica]|uniref:Uncharacterized protein n=1 Tax=Meganyctiphanes norvegica TaxID=48144 RepID=A0AAV2SAA3_MEGNR
MMQECEWTPYNTFNHDIKGSFWSIIFNHCDCRVHQNYIWEKLSEEYLSFSNFIEFGEVLSCKIYFQGQNKHFVYDQLVLSNEEIILYKVRHGSVDESVFSKFLDTAGWTWIEISITEQFTLKYWNTTALEYTMDQTVDQLFLHGSNISVCKEKSPTWIVDKEISVTIPLQPSRQVENPSVRNIHVLNLKLQSYNDFTPCIAVGSNKTCLEEVKLLELSPSQERMLDLHLELVTGFIHIYKKIGGKQENIAIFPKQGMKFIELTSSNSNFSATLNVFGEPKSSFQTPVRENGFNVKKFEEPFDYGKIGYIFIGIVIGIVICGSVFIVILR